MLADQLPAVQAARQPGARLVEPVQPLVEPLPVGQPLEVRVQLAVAQARLLAAQRAARQPEAPQRAAPAQRVLEEQLPAAQAAPQVAAPQRVARPEAPAQLVAPARRLVTPALALRLAPVEPLVPGAREPTRALVALRQLTQVPIPGQPALPPPRPPRPTMVMTAARTWAGSACWVWRGYLACAGAPRLMCLRLITEPPGLPVDDDGWAVAE